MAALFLLPLDATLLLLQTLAQHADLLLGLLQRIHVRLFLHLQKVLHFARFLLQLRLLAQQFLLVLQRTTHIDLQRPANRL
uniref:Putative secreted peptide n=1 Tax=Anopheles braziliensis TaxID=58242 RepID=A0A2M3ZXG8_9DIPT